MPILLHRDHIVQQRVPPWACCARTCLTGTFESLKVQSLLLFGTLCCSGCNLRRFTMTAIVGSSRAPQGAPQVPPAQQPGIVPLGARSTKKENPQFIIHLERLSTVMVPRVRAHIDLLTLSLSTKEGLRPRTPAHPIQTQVADLLHLCAAGSRGRGREPALVTLQIAISCFPCSPGPSGFIKLSCHDCLRQEKHLFFVDQCTTAMCLVAGEGGNVAWRENASNCCCADRAGHWC